MGAFYGSVHVRSEDVVPVRQALEEIAAAGRTRFLMGPPSGGWIGVYPSDHGQDPAVSAAIAERIHAPLIHLVVHDDDVFAYVLYDAGGPIDEYDSHPDYFETAPATRWQETAGRAEALATLAGGGCDPAEIERTLDRDGSDGSPFRATWQLARLAKQLGIVNAETSYEYLRAGEVRGIEGWKQFVHVPDLSDEKAAKRRARAEVAAATRRLQAEGTLLVVQKPASPRVGLPPSPVFCAHPRGGFLLAWAVFGRPEDEPLQWWQPPWRAPSETGLAVSSRVHRLQTSGSGRFLAVGHASGEWSTALFDLEERRRMTTVPLSRATTHVSFTPDERTLILRSEGELHLVPVRGAGDARRISLGLGSSAGTHPDGRWLVADVSAGSGPAGVAVVDLQAGRVVSVPSTRRHDLGAWMAAHAAGEEVESGFHPQEVPRKVDFTPDGRLVVLAVQEGVRVYSWDALREARSALPPPLFSGGTALVQGKTGWMRHTYDFAIDAGRGRVLFAGLDGVVRALGFQTGETTTVLEVPGAPAILELVLSGDGATLATCGHQGLLDRGAKRSSVWQVWSLDALDAMR
jgi:hypothetical protein